MATNKLPVKINGVERRIEVADLPDKSGLSGYYYNYRFLLKQLKNKKWRAIVYRPGAERSCASFNDKPPADLATIALEYIIKQYHSLSKPSKK